MNINGIDYTYTGGETTRTLTGVTPDPSNNIDTNDTVFQQIVTNVNKPASGFNNDIIEELNNQIYVASDTQNEVLVSKNTSFTDYTFASPRIPGEGATLVLPSAIKTIIPQENDMYIGAGDSWFRTRFEQIDVGGTLSETLNVKQVNSGTGQGAKANSLVAKAKNSIVFISNDNTLEELARLENFVTPQFKTISDPIKPDFTGEDFTNGHIKFFKNQIFISAPVNDKTYIYDLEKGFWQPPQILPVRQYAIIDGDLYGHSDIVAETYRLFTGTNDNNNAFNAIAAFSYRNYGDRVSLKSFDEWYTEGYISGNTDLVVTFNYELDGSEQTLDAIIKGNDEGILFEIDPLGALGDLPLGNVSLGLDTTDGDVLPKFRTISTLPRDDFYELQVVYSTDEIDRQWELLSVGGNVTRSMSGPNFIKR